MNSSRLQYNFAYRIPANGTGLALAARTNCGCVFSHRARRLLVAVLLLFSLFCCLQSASAASESNGTKPQSELCINDWQGAKNYSESFPITVTGGSAGGGIRFLCSNCTVSPATGTTNDTYSVTVSSAGNYSLTAIMSGNNEYAEVSDSRRGVGGKFDQAPLNIEGWGKSKGYYRTFAIRVTGGTLGGAITFETDGCTVSPVTGPVGSQFTVTVTRVGTYTLTAFMDGDKNNNKACSAPQSGVACKSEQSPISISGWQTSATYGDTFSVNVSGGTTNEALNVTASGCTLNPTGDHRYEVTVNSVGPYSITAIRAGNYGYTEASGYATGMSKKAEQKSVSISGWSNDRSVGDTFPVTISGGIPDGAVSFATSGCTISPITGTTDSQYFVTVGSVGTYTLTAYIEGTANYNSAHSKEVKGSAQKAPQTQLSVDNWNGGAATGSSFDIHVLGGSGTGTTSVTTSGGCYAVPNSELADTYTVTVTAQSGVPYSLSACKLGDANYFDGDAASVKGVAGKKNQPPLSVNGWKDSAQAGDAFAIHLDNGTNSGKVEFEATGCIIEPASGDIDDVYTITVTAIEGETYSVSIRHDGNGGYEQTSVLKSGNVRPTVKLHNDSERTETETPMLGANYDIALLLGMVILLIILLVAAFILQCRERRYRRRYR